MPERTGYANDHRTDEEELEDLTDEISSLDWSNNSGASIGEAKALVAELWEKPTRDDEDDIREVISEIPAEFRETVLRAIMGESPEALSEALTEALTENGRTEFEKRPSAAEEFRDRPGLEWEREKTQHVMKYLEDSGCEDLIERLEHAMEDSRKLEPMREMRGDHLTYGQSGVHEKYVGCIADLPAALEARQAMTPDGWDQNELREAALHEVNRMGYRTNLEIQDRIMKQFSYGPQMARMAEKNGMSEEVVERIAAAGFQKKQWIENQQLRGDPTEHRVETAVKIAALEIHLFRSIQRGDEKEVWETLVPPDSPEELEERANAAMADVGKEEREAMTLGLEIARGWSDDAIQDGGMKYRLPYANPDHEYGNGERERWIEETGQTGERLQTAGDCVTRALNEAIGGGEYAALWQEITEQTQTRYSHKDADVGVDPRDYGKVYETHGMRNILDAVENVEHIMRGHLDIREIPALLGHLFPDEDQQLAYIGCSETHAVAVVDGTLRDSWDSRDMADPDKYVNFLDGTLTQIWLKTDDDSIVEQALDAIRKYEDVRRYDDVLTYGRKHRLETALRDR